MSDTGETGVPPADSSPDTGDPSEEPDADSVERAEEVARLADARYQKRVKDLYGRLRKANPDIPASAATNDRALVEYLASLKPASQDDHEPPTDDPDEDPDRRQPRPRTISYDRHRQELTRARKESAKEASTPLMKENEVLKTENARLKENLRKHVTHAVVRRLCDDPDLDLVPDGVLRYLDSPDPDDPFTLRPGEKPETVIVWDSREDAEALDARGQPLEPQEYLARLPKRPGLEYLKRTRLPGGTGSGDGAAGGESGPARRPGKKPKDPFEDPDETTQAGWAEFDARQRRGA